MMIGFCAIGDMLTGTCPVARPTRYSWPCLAPPQPTITSGCFLAICSVRIERDSVDTGVQDPRLDQINANCIPRVGDVITGAVITTGTGTDADPVRVDIECNLADYGVCSEVDIPGTGILPECMGDVKEEVFFDCVFDDVKEPKPESAVCASLRFDV